MQNNNFIHSSRQNQANELLRVQQSSVEREHELAEDFRLKISKLKQEITQIKNVYDDRLLNVNKEHRGIIERLHEEHQIELDNIKIELKQIFDVENEAQKKYYLQTIEELKREHNDLLLEEKNKQMTQNEMDEEYLKEKKQLEKQIEFYQEEIQQIKYQFQLELNEQKNLFDMKSNDYQQLQNNFQEYKLNFNANSNSLTDINEQVDYLKANNRKRIFYFI